MTKRHLVESRLGEPIIATLNRAASEGKTIGYAANLMDVSYTCARNWAVKHDVQFNPKHPFRKWRGNV